MDFGSFTGLSVDLHYKERQGTWVEQEGWEVGCGEEESGSGQEEGGVASVIVCMVARAQWLSAAYTRVDWEQRQTGTPQEGKWLSESFNLLL